MAQKVPEIESSGWIKLYRSLFFHEFADEPWNRITAWLYLVSFAAYKPYDATYRRHVYHLERGQAAIVMSDLAMKAQWSKWRVKRFFDLLVKKDMVVVKGDFTCCVLTILNYEKYQSENAALPATANATPTATATATANDCPALTIEDLLATPTATPTATANATQNKKVVQEVLRKVPKTMSTLPPEVSEVLAYLNEKMHTKLREPHDLPTRLHDGYTVEDCKKVIDIKYAEWYGTEQEKYIRPSTLFRKGHFDEYLNQPTITKETLSHFVEGREDLDWHLLLESDQYARSCRVLLAFKEAEKSGRVAFTKQDYDLKQLALAIKSNETHILIKGGKA